MSAMPSTDAEKLAAIRAYVDRYVRGEEMPRNWIPGLIKIIDDPPLDLDRLTSQVRVALIVEANR